MKALTFLTNMRRKVSAKVCGNDVSLDRRLTVGSLSGFGSKSLLKFVSVLTLIFTLGVGNAWASNWTGTSATNAPAGTYKAMTSGEAVVAGDTIIVVHESDQLAMSTTQNTNNRGTVSITVSSSTVTLNGSTAVQALTVGTSAVSGAWILTTVNGYLYAPSYNSSTSNYLRTETTNKDKAGGDWVIGYNSIVANGNGTRRYIRRNGTLISCYASGAQNEIKVYKKAHTVTYNANGGSTTCSDATLYKSNANVTVCATEPTRSNYNFTGWAANVDLKNASTSATITAGTLIAAGTTIVMPAKFVVLTAQWESAATCDENATVSGGSLKGSVSSSSEATAQCTGGITNLGGAGCSITSYGFAVGTSTNPTIGGTLTGTGKTYQVGTTYTTTSTAFEKLIDGLSASTKYYVRPYATNGNGTAYGTEFNFTTLAACTAAPTVTAGSTGTVTSTTAVVNCSSGLSALGTGGCTVTSYGFVYGTSENPTTSNSTNEVGTSYTTTGTSFNTTLTSLTEGQLYYVRPYATNGYETGYGTQTSFGTPKITTSLSTRNFGDRKVNGGPYTMTFKVSGVYLQSDISIAKSGTNQAMFSIDKATISQTDGTAAETTITVSYSPTAAGSHSATLTLTSTNATNKTVTLSGTGKWEVTWDVSGSSPTTTLVANSTKPTLPDPAGITSCDGTSTTFIGWTKTPWVGKQNQTYIDGLTGDDVVHTDNTTMSNVTANGTTYYAVFAQANVVEGSKTINITPDTLTSYASVNKKIGGITFKSSNNWGKQTCSSYTYIQGKSGSNFYNDDAFPGYIKSITINPWGSTSCGTVTQGSGTLYIGTSSQPTTNSTTLPTSETTYNYTKTNNYTYFKINASTTLVLFSISITYAADDISYSNYLTTCCNTSTLAFGASPYAVIRQDIQGASTTTWAEVDVTFTSNNTTGTISATTYTSGKTVYSLSTWQSRATTGGSLCATDHAYFEVLTQPSDETPGTGKFHVKTTSGQTGQGTYRIAITQASTDEDHGNFCEKTVYGFVDVTLRDKFVDVVNGNGTVNKDGHGAQLATPLLSELGTQVENACHSEGRKLKGWIKETDLKSKYETGNSERVQTIDGLCETCDDATDWTSLIVAPGTNVTMSGATWYAVWAYER